jgi:uncharacterized membrane protein SpoIIM required for sporulation
MNLDQLLQQRRPAWKQLATILDHVYRRGPRRTPPEEVQKLLELYRQASADLARLRAAGGDPEDIRYLNRLVTRAHGQIYRHRHDRGPGLAAFLRNTFPQLVWESRYFIFASLLIGVLFAGMAYHTVRTSPDIVTDIMQGGDREFRGTKTVADIHDRFRVVPAPLLTSFVTTNNIKVALFAFAAGITFGLGTIYVLAVNGTMLGGLAGACSQSGVGTDFWMTILPHGALELSAIVVAGGSGLMIGYALWCPGQRTRRRALREEVTKAAQIVVGLIPAFVVAGMIEGFVTPSDQLSATTKLALGIAVAVAFWLYCGLGALGPTSEPLASF